MLALDAPRVQFPSFLLGAAIATAGWLLLAHLGASGGLDRRSFRGAVALAVAARLIAVFLPPAFSEDVFRYVFEGRAVWSMGPLFPMLHAPAGAPALGVPPALLDDAWSRINHPELPTIYPPFSALVFALAGGAGELIGGGHLLVLKLALVAADLGSWRISVMALEKIGRRPEESVAIGLCPVLVLEVAREGHADSLALLGLAIGIAGFLAAAPRQGFAGFALAMLAKLNGALGLLAGARSTRRHAAIAGAALILVALPYLVATGGAGKSLGEYATRWRAGDGAFSILLLAAEALLGGDWARFGAVTITRHELARAFAALAFTGFAAVLLRERAPLEEVPARTGLLLLALLLLSPTLHPWYALWLLPALPYLGRARPAAFALLSLVWLAHHAAHLEAITGAWTDLAEVRAAIHLPVWALLAASAVRLRGTLARCR